MASHSFQCEAGLEQQPTNQDGKALQYVSEKMKGDRELCMAAVTQVIGGGAGIARAYKQGRRAARSVYGY